MGHTPSKAFRIRVFLFSAFSGDPAAIGMGDGHDYFAFERCSPEAAFSWVGPCGTSVLAEAMRAGAGLSSRWAAPCMSAHVACALMLLM